MIERTILTLILNFLLISIFGQDFVVSTPKQRLLPLDNLVQICANGYSFESLYVTNTNGTIRKTDRGFIIHPLKPGNTKIEVYSIIGNDTILIGTKYIAVHSFVPYTEASLSGKRRGTISKKTLLAQIGLRADVINQEIQLSFPITSFRLIIMRGDSLIFTKVFSSFRFDNEIKDAFSLTESGDMLHFLEITAENPISKKNTILEDISIMVE